MYTGGCNNITKIRIKFYTHEIKNKTFSSIKQNLFYYIHAISSKRKIKQL